MSEWRLECPRCKGKYPSMDYVGKNAEGKSVIGCPHCGLEKGTYKTGEPECTPGEIIKIPHLDIELHVQQGGILIGKIDGRGLFGINRSMMDQLDNGTYEGIAVATAKIDTMSRILEAIKYAQLNDDQIKIVLDPTFKPLGSINCAVKLMKENVIYLIKEAIK